MAEPHPAPNPQAPGDPPGAECAVDTFDRFARAPHMAEVRRLSRVSSLRSVGLIGLQWAVLVGAICFAFWVPTWWAALLAGVVVATRQQAMGVLVHDGAHYLLFNNRAVNDIVCDLLLAFPVGMSTTLYRQTHFRHHRFTNTEQDGDLAAQRAEREWYEWPKTPRGLALVLLRTLTGWNAVRAWPMVKQWSPAVHLFDPLTPAFPLRARLLFLSSGAAFYAVFGWFAAVWPWGAVKLALLFLVPGFTLLNLVNRLRATAEHVGAPNDAELTATRTVLPRWYERLVVAPVGVSYHLEHHLFPSVPGPNLAELHRVLMRDPAYRERAHVAAGYTGVLRELMGARPAGTGPRAHAGVGPVGDGAAAGGAG